MTETSQAANNFQHRHGSKGYAEGAARTLPKAEFSITDRQYGTSLYVSLDGGTRMLVTSCNNWQVGGCSDREIAMLLAKALGCEVIKE